MTCVCTVGGAHSRRKDRWRKIAEESSRQEDTNTDRHVRKTSARHPTTPWFRRRRGCSMRGRRALPRGGRRPQALLFGGRPRFFLGGSAGTATASLVDASASAGASAALSEAGSAASASGADASPLLVGFVSAGRGIFGGRPRGRLATGSPSGFA